VDSVLRSSYKPIEVIVVDNASTDGTEEELRTRYAGKIKLIKSDKNLYAAGGRNLGAKSAGGEYLLFIDSDNTVARDMVSNMVEGFIRNKDLAIGMSGPFMYYKSEPRRLSWVNNKMSLLTSITLFEGSGEIDNGQYSKYDFIRVHHIPNVFMMPKAAFEEVGGIDEDYVMHYEESDLAEKLKRRGLAIVLFPRAKVWHNVSLGRKEGHKSFKGENPKMVYFVSRNRIIFMRKNSSGIRLFLFMAIFNNIFLLYNLALLSFYGKFALWKPALKGYLDGLFMPLVNR
jgi:GT2 family glycosyltransferase